MGQEPLPDKNSSSIPSKAPLEEEWRTRTHLGIMIENIPAHWMIAELKSFLDEFGTIAKVEIFEDRQVLLFPTWLTIDW